MFTCPATLYIVVPCYNESEVFPITAPQLTELVKKMIHDGKISDKSRILYVNDGSRDNTWKLIEAEYKSNKYASGLKLAGNVGHQNALFAGLMAAKDKCDISVSIDADLQDPRRLGFGWKKPDLRAYQIGKRRAFLRGRARRRGDHPLRCF